MQEKYTIFFFPCHCIWVSSVQFCWVKSFLGEEISQWTRTFKKRQFVLTTIQGMWVFCFETCCLIENSMLIWSGVWLFVAQIHPTEHSFLNTTIFLSIHVAWSYQSLKLCNLFFTLILGYHQPSTKSLLRTCLQGLVGNHSWVSQVHLDSMIFDAWRTKCIWGQCVLSCCELRTDSSQCMLDCPQRWDLLQAWNSTLSNNFSSLHNASWTAEASDIFSASAKLGVGVVVICFHNLSICHQRKRHILLSISSNPDLQLNPHHSYHKASHTNFPRIQFSSNPENILLRWLRILLTTVQCSCSGLDQSLATGARFILQYPNMFVLGQDATNTPPLCMENFPWFLLLLWLWSPNPCKVNSRLSKSVKLHTIWHWKTLSSTSRTYWDWKIVQLLPYFLWFMCIFFISTSAGTPFLMWDCVEMLVLNAWTTCLSHKEVKSSTWLVKIDTVLWFSRRKLMEKARVLLWLFELKLQQSWMKQLVPVSLGNCFNLATNSSGIHTSFLQ